MKTLSKFFIISALALPLGVGAVTANAAAGEHKGGHEMMGGHGGRHHHQKPLNLTEQQVRTLADAKLIMMSNSQLKVGAIEKSGANGYKVNLVTQSNQPAFSYVINTDNGRVVREKRDWTTAQVKTLMDARLIRKGKADTVKVKDVKKEGDVFTVSLLNTEKNTTREIKFDPSRPHHKMKKMSK